MSRGDGLSQAWREHFAAQGAGVVERDRQDESGERAVRPPQGWAPVASRPTFLGGGAHLETGPGGGPEAPGGAVNERLARVGRSVATFVGPVVMLDFLLGLAFMFAGYPVAPALPGFMVAAAAVVGVAMFRRTTLRVTGGGLMVLVAVSTLGYLIAVSMHNGQPWTQRILKFVLFLLLSVILATGRLNIRSFVIGLCAGAFINVPLYYAGIAPDNYPPYLSGFYGDKNVAGMYYAVWGALGIAVFRGKTLWVWIAASGMFCFFTGSRTAMAAFIGAVAWIAMRNRVGVSYRVMLGALGMSALLWAVDNIAEVQAFGDRTGTDWYRHQIERAMQAKLDVTPWYGLGLNQGQAVIGHRPQWFHDSYSQAFVEGGYLNLWVVVGAFVLLGVGLFDRRLHISRELLAAEGAMIALLICAWKLGEALMTVPAFVALGVAIAYRLGTPVEQPRGSEDRYEEAMERHRVQSAELLEEAPR